MAVVEAWQAWQSHWLEKRLPSARSILLDRHKVFILPSKLAIAWLVMTGLLLVMGINFQNSLVYAVCFWLLALLILNLLHTWHNLAGLTVTAIGVEACFAGETARVEIALSCPDVQRKFAIILDWPGEDCVQVDLATTNNVHIYLTHRTSRRGYFQLPRLRIASRYPTGLAVAWSHVLLDMRGLVYPRPVAKAVTEIRPAQAHTDQTSQPLPDGSSDFSHLRDYRSGDALRQVHWGKYAQTGKLYVKTFVDYASHDRWLDWSALPMPGVEVRLSHLCSQVLACEQAGQRYGLKLPGTVIAPHQGEAHRNRCLRALALYGLDSHA